MKKYIPWIVLFLMLFSCFNFGLNNSRVVQAISGFGESNIYYGYGDSVMRAVGGCGFEGDGDECWVLQMQERCDPDRGSDHCMDGGGKTSAWGKDNFGTYITNWSNVHFEAFGINDWWAGSNEADPMPIDQAAANKLEMCEYAYENNSLHRYFACIMTLGGGADVTKPFSMQSDQINASESLLRNYSVKYIPLYDAIDDNPWSGDSGFVGFDNWDNDWYDVPPCESGLHPNPSGHIEMADFAWFFVNGNDSQIRYFIDNYTYVVDVNYTEPIYITLKSNWTYSSTSVNCTTNSTEIDFHESTDFNGNTTLWFWGESGSSYEVTSTTVDFPTILFINNESNNTQITVIDREVNWSIMTDADSHHIQIGNDSSFSDVFVNLNDLNETNYGANFDENSARVWFKIADITTYGGSYGTHYYRVRTKVKKVTT